MVCASKGLCISDLSLFVPFLTLKHTDKFIMLCVSFLASLNDGGLGFTRKKLVFVGFWGFFVFFF